MKGEEKKFLKHLGKQIAAKRKAAGLTKQGLADKVDLTRMTIYRIENGEHSPAVTVLIRIAKELGVDMEQLVNIDRK